MPVFQETSFTVTSSWIFMFDEFPKIRPVLPQQYREIFEKHYLENREGRSRSSGVTQRLEAWMHHRVADDVNSRGGKILTLEIGAGTLNHLPYEKGVYPYDIVEPNEWLFQPFPERRKLVQNFYPDVFQIPEERCYQRIISIATFEQLTDLPMVVAKAGLLLAEGGVLRIAIPNEGCWPWKLGYRLTNGVEFYLRYGLNYNLIMRHEHVNTAPEIENVLCYFFTRTRCCVMGFTKKLSFYRFYICENPARDRCEVFLTKR